MIWKWRISFHEKNTHFFILYYNSLQQRAVHRCLFIHSFFLFSSLLLSLAFFLRTHYFSYTYIFSCMLLSVNCYYTRTALHSEGFYIFKAKYGKWFANRTGSVSIWGNGRAFKVINTYITHVDLHIRDRMMMTCSVLLYSYNHKEWRGDHSTVVCHKHSQLMLNILKFAN